MPAAPLPANEPERLAAIASYTMLDGTRDDWTDEIVAVAATLSDCPIAIVSIVDTEHQWFKGCVGLGVNETPRSQAFCAYTILDGTPLVVADAAEDERFADNPLVTGPPHIRFYAGAPLIDANGLALGCLCVIDDEPRQLQPSQLESLSRLAKIVVRHLTAQRRTEAAEAASLEARAHADELARLNRSLAQSQAELAAKNRELERFVYTASHDLKSPIVTIQGYASFLKQDLTDGRHDRVEQFMERIDAATKRMRDNIDDLLELSRIGRAKQEAELVDTYELLSDLVREFETQIAGAGAVVTIEDDVPAVFADRARLRQAFQNLLGNAIKYAGVEGRGPRITVGGAVSGDELRLFVADDGPGIAADHHERVFDLFQRLETSVDGTGVGLAIVQRIAEVHGGRAWVESAPGEGATFFFGLPAHADAPAPARVA